MKILFAVISLFLSIAFPAAAYAQEINGKSINCAQLDISQYNQNELIDIQNICNASKAAAEKVTPEDVREWASLGKEFSDAVIETAKGLGVTANEFLGTPVGVLLALYFMWDIIGGILIGIPLLIAIWILYFKIINVYINRECEYTYVPVLFGLFNRKKLVKRNISDPADTVVTMVVVAIPALALSALILGVLIF